MADFKFHYKFSRRILIIAVLIIILLVLNHFREYDKGKAKRINEPPVSCSNNDDYQNQLNYIASFLKVEFLVRQEININIQLSNTGSNDILNCDWEIYFSLSVFPKNPEYNSNVFNMSNVNGLLFKIFSNLPSNESILMPSGGTEVITLNRQMPTKYFAFPNWFIVGRNAFPRVIVSTNVTNQLKMVSIDMTYTSADRFLDNENLKRTEGGVESLPIKLVIPTPLHLDTNPSMEYLNLSSGWVIGYDSPNVTFEAGLLAEFLNTTKHQSPSSESKMIFLQLKAITDNDKFDLLNSTEAYRVTTSVDNRVLLEAPTPSGIFYGVQTIISLCRNNKSKAHEKMLPVVNITDAPRYKHRGLMVDVARHFQSVATLKKLITVMSTYKMNRLHIHLTDDEGWRIQIPKLPELTSIGARPTAKLHSRPKFDFLNTHLGDTPKDNSTVNFTRQYYTPEEYRSIVRHGALHHVAIIPELDFPGHSHAALVSMRHRKNRLRLEDDDDAEEYDLEDENDVSDDTSITNVVDTVINICKNSTIHFMRTVVETVIQMHEMEQPLPMFHLGGDEVSHTALLGSPICQGILNPSHKKVSSYVQQVVLGLGEYFNKTVLLWATNGMERDFEGRMPPILYFWQPSKERDKVLRDYVDAGLEIILAEADILYLDSPYEPSTQENGLRWATNSTNEYDVFNYIPPNPCADGDEEDDDDCCVRMNQVLGIQASMWGELLYGGVEMTEEMIFPRLLSVAERAWHEADWQKGKVNHEALLDDWSAFSRALVQRELSVLDGFEVKYRIPPPGGRKTSDGHIEYNTILPGLPVVMSADGGNTWVELDSYDNDKEILLATMSPDGKRMSRVVPLDAWTSETLTISRKYHHHHHR